jgi:hypothetical protein
MENSRFGALEKKERKREGKIKDQTKGVGRIGELSR